MKDKKKILIALVVAVAIVLILVLCSSCRNSDISNNLNENNDNDKVNTYVEEFNNAKYSMRVLESDTKEYVTLFIETNNFDGTEKVNVVYDSNKYTLDRANPLVSDILPEAIEGTENRKQFQLELSARVNYSVDFIKKNPDSVPSIEDIDLK